MPPMSDAPPIDAPPAPPAGDQPPAPPAADGGAPAKPQYTPEQQAHIDQMAAEIRAQTRAAAEQATRAKVEAEIRQLAEREQMDAAARAQAEKNDLEQAAAEKVTAAEKRAMQADARAELAALGVPKASLATALRLVDLESIENPDDADAIAAACAAAIAAVPGLIPAAGTPAPGAPSGGEFGADGTGKVWTAAEIAALSIEDYDKHRDAIQEQMRTIGIK